MDDPAVRIEVARIYRAGMEHHLEELAKGASAYQQIDYSGKAEQRMAELLGIPYEKRTQAGLFPVAYTLGTDFKPAPRRPLEDVVHWNHW